MFTVNSMEQYNSDKMLWDDLAKSDETSIGLQVMNECKFNLNVV